MNARVRDSSENPFVKRPETSGEQKIAADSPAAGNAQKII